MSKAKLLILILLLTACAPRNEIASLPTVAVLPSLTPSDTPTNTPTFTASPRPSRTFTPTLTATATPTPECWIELWWSDMELVVEQFVEIVDEAAQSPRQDVGPLSMEALALAYEVLYARPPRCGWYLADELYWGMFGGAMGLQNFALNGPGLGTQFDSPNQRLFNAYRALQDFGLDAPTELQHAELLWGGRPANSANAVDSEGYATMTAVANTQTLRQSSSIVCDFGNWLVDTDANGFYNLPFFETMQAIDLEEVTTETLRAAIADLRAQRAAFAEPQAPACAADLRRAMLEVMDEGIAIFEAVAVGSYLLAESHITAFEIAQGGVEAELSALGIQR